MTSRKYKITLLILLSSLLLLIIGPAITLILTLAGYPTRVALLDPTSYVTLTAITLAFYQGANVAQKIFTKSSLDYTQTKEDGYGGQPKNGNNS